MKLSSTVKKGIAITCGLYVFHALGTGLLIRVLVSGLVTDAVSKELFKKEVERNLNSPLKGEYHE